MVLAYNLLYGEPVRRFYQGLGVRGIESRVSAIGNELKVGFWPCAMQIPRGGCRADHIVAALHNYSGDMADEINVIEQLILVGKKALVYKVVALNAGHCQRGLGLVEFFHKVFVL